MSKSVSAFGVNHKTAPIAIRERLAFDPSTMMDSLKQLKQDAGLEEVAVLSTCNRMEVYFRGDELASQRLKQWLASNHTLELNELEQCTYVHEGEQAIQHVMRVACGLDSMVLGEPQILGQMKDAFQSARQAGTLGQLLDRLFQQTFLVAKKVRTDTQIGSSAVSVAYAAVSLSKKIFTDFSDVTALYIGAGETIELAARHFHNLGVNKMIVANRTEQRAATLALQFGGTAIALNDLPQWIHKADVVISSTASPLPIVGKGMIEACIKKRKHKPMFMVDLAVPRDIESAVGELNDVYLYSVDDLKDVITENMKARTAAAEEAEDIVMNQTENFLGWLKSLQSVDLVKQYRHQIEQVKDEELKLALEQLQTGEPSELVLQKFAHRLTKKIMHRPSQVMREDLIANDQQKQNWIKRLFGLSSDSHQ